MMTRLGAELFSAWEASWRILMLLLFGGFSMAADDWLAGLLYDYFGLYAPTQGQHRCKHSQFDVGRPLDNTVALLRGLRFSSLAKREQEP
jgi:hypothetical protein